MFILVIASLSALESARASDWEWMYPRPIGVPINHSTLTPDRTIWAVGMEGEVIRSNDLGVSFTRCTAQEHRNLLSVAAYDSLKAIVVGESNYIAQTVDGGRVWTTLTLPNEAIPASVCISDSGEIWVGCLKGMVLRFRNVVDSWTQFPVGDDADITCITSYSERVICGGENRIWYKRNDDTMWSRRTLPDIGSIRTLQCDMKGVAWVGGCGKSYIVTFPNGQAQALVGSGTGSLCLVTHDGVTVLSSICSAITVCRSTDSGSTWQKFYDTRYYSMLWVTDSTFVGFTSNGIVHRSSDNGSTWVKSVPKLQNFVRLEQLSNGTFWAIPRDRRTTIWESRDTCRTWSKLSGEWSSVSGILPASDSTAYVWSSNTIDRTTDGGRTWMTLLTSDSELRSVQVLLRGQVIMAQSQSELIASSDSGMTWDTLNTTLAYNDVILFDNDSVGYLLHDTCGLYRTFDRGRTWHEIPTNRCLWKLLLSQGGVLWATSDIPVALFSTNDSGLTWEPKVNSEMILTGNGIRALCASWLYYVYTSTDNGATWMEDSVLIGRYGTTTKFTSDGNLYAVGEYGIRRRVDKLVSVDVREVSNDAGNIELGLADGLCTDIYSLTGELQWIGKPISEREVLQSLPQGLWIVRSVSRGRELQIRKVAKY